MDSLHIDPFSSSLMVYLRFLRVPTERRRLRLRSTPSIRRIQSDNSRNLNWEQRTPASSRARAERPKTFSNSPENGVESITLAAAVSDGEIHASNGPNSNPARATVIAGQIGRAHNLSRCFKPAVRSRIGSAKPPV